MLDNILNLEGVSVLSKKQQKAINGKGCGFTATAYLPNGDSYTYTFYDDNATKADVMDGLSYAYGIGASEGNWCCASCDSASWL